MSRVATLMFASALLIGGQCGLSDHTGKTLPLPGGAIQNTWASPDSLIALKQPLQPCGFYWTWRDDQQRLLGGIDTVWSTKSMSDTTRVRYDDTTSTRACMYLLTERPGVPKGSVFAFEILVDNAIGFETGAQVMTRSARSMLDLIGAKTADGAQHGVDGWDYLGAYSRELTARVGHIAFHGDWGGVAVSPDSVERFFALLRSELGDYPIRALGRGSEAGEEDPCSLVTRQEAETILGKLLAPPYESRDLSGLVDSTGTGCSYYTKNHHVLSIRPWWSHGKMVFPVTGATRPIPNAGVVDRQFKFDKEAADPVGNFYFLRGDRLLAVSWKTSSTDGEGALKIAAIAMKSIAK